MNQHITSDGQRGTERPASSDAGAADHQADAASGQDDVVDLRRQLHASRLQSDRLRDELALVRRELSQVRAEQEVVSEQLARYQAGTEEASLPASRKLGRTGRLRLLRNLRRGLSRTQGERQRELALLRQSTLFDAEWYLRHYPDVSAAVIDPAEHYLRFGAREGRDPGPRFSTHGYLLDHPELVDQGTNPLVHFILAAPARGGHAPQ